MTTTPCPFASHCWMAGNYVFCKTATCKEPLIERMTGVEPPKIILPPAIDATSETEEHDNGGEGAESNAEIQSIQGELF